MKSGLNLFICSTVILYHVQSTHQYKKLYIESDSLCSEITKRKIQLDKENNSALIVKQKRLNEHSLDWELNKYCKFQVNSPFVQSGGILAVIQYLNFRRDPITDECIDYVQFRPKDGSLSRKFCGVINATVLMHQKHTDPHGPLIYETSGIDYRGELDVYINISKKALLPSENADINIVFTSYKHCSKNHGTESLQPCSEEINTFCIWSGFFHDGPVNCPYADCTDEGGCIKKGNESIGNKVLISSISALFVLFIIFVLLIWACKKHKILCWSEEFSNPTPTPPTDASQNRTIEMNEQTGARLATQQVTRAPSAPVDEDKDLPPSYDSLFPDTR